MQLGEYPVASLRLNGRRLSHVRGESIRGGFTAPSRTRAARGLILTP